MLPLQKLLEQHAFRQILSQVTSAALLHSALATAKVTPTNRDGDCSDASSWRKSWNFARTDPLISLAHARRSKCAQCGEQLFVPEWSEYLDSRRVRHLWHCEHCGYNFETTIRFAAA